jgi:23S rRNA pseudouridine1911/1915/1917 synthase
MKQESDSLEQRIVYEDNHILVVNKLPSEIVQGDKTGDRPLSESIMAFIKSRDHKPGNVFCGVIHRLDRPVSGLVIFAKTSKALARFNEMLRERTVDKRYLAVVERQPPEVAGRLQHYLLKNEKTNTSRAYTKPVDGALKAELEYELLDKSDKYFLLKVNLLTGRHHQIRCQLSAIGCPIKGDLKYGAKRSNEKGFIHLHSHELSFLHPIKKEPVSLHAMPAFDDPLWRFFSSRITQCGK